MSRWEFGELPNGKQNTMPDYEFILARRPSLIQVLGDLVQVGADIVKRALCYPLKLIAKNAGVNGSVVVEKVGFCPA